MIERRFKATVAGFEPVLDNNTINARSRVLKVSRVRQARIVPRRMGKWPERGT